MYIKLRLQCLSSGRIPAHITSKYVGMDIEIVKDLHYLGALLTKTGNFKKAINAQADKGTKAMFEILKKGKFHGLTISCQLGLSDTVVKPIFYMVVLGFTYLYTCMLEKVHLKSCKLLSNLKSSPPSCFIYGELGRFPLSVDVKQRMVFFWSRLM